MLQLVTQKKCSVNNVLTFQVLFLVVSGVCENQYFNIKYADHESRRQVTLKSLHCERATLTYQNIVRNGNGLKIEAKEELIYFRGYDLVDGTGILPLALPFLGTLMLCGKKIEVNCWLFSFPGESV